MDVGNLDDHKPSRVLGECRDEGLQVTDVVGHVMTTDHVGCRYLPSDVRPPARDAMSSNTVCASPLGKQAEHPFVRVDCSQRRGARKERQAGGPPPWADA